MNLTDNQIRLIASIAAATQWSTDRVRIVEVSHAWDIPNPMFDVANLVTPCPSGGRSVRAHVRLFDPSSIAGIVRSLVRKGIVEATRPWESAPTIGLTARGLDVLYEG